MNNAEAYQSGGGLRIDKLGVNNVNYTHGI